MIQGVNNNTYSYSTQGPFQDDPVQDEIQKLEKEAAPYAQDQDAIIGKITTKLGSDVALKVSLELLAHGKLDANLELTLSENGIDVTQLLNDVSTVASYEAQIEKLMGGDPTPYNPDIPSWTNNDPNTGA